MSGSTLAIETPLAALHRAGGASMGEWFGCALPSDWGNAAAEERFAVESVALIDKNYRAYLAFAGPDRVRYLNAILTNSVKELGEGQGIVSLLLNPQGRILAEIETYVLGERLFCVSYAMIRARLVEWLEKYIIMDDVTLTDETERFGILAERSDLERLWGALSSAARGAGGGPMGYAALSARRLTQGIPWFGYDFGEQQIPHEAGLELSHISYTKGCYTGQEIVERVRSRGQVNRRRARLQFEGGVVPSAGASLAVDGKEVGQVTRASRSFYPPAILGMGYVRKEHAEAGSIVEWSLGQAKVL